MGNNGAEQPVDLNQSIPDRDTALNTADMNPATCLQLADIDNPTSFLEGAADYAKNNQKEDPIGKFKR
ncbi:MAG: hypothetical protein LUQ07_02335 [Methanospirillum sp.]|nr:hypothetical protein [Methanospirillum sp.]